MSPDENQNRREFNPPLAWDPICGFVYDEEKGYPEDDIAPGTKWEDVPPNWSCPECGARKEDFEMIEI